MVGAPMVTPITFRLAEVITLWSSLPNQKSGCKFNLYNWTGLCTFLYN